MPKPHKTRLRIIGGRYKGQSITVTASEKCRPTTDRARETLFNWLMHDISASQCLDLYAGSGALGLEAISRGAKAVTFVDHNTKVCRQIWQSIEQLGVTSCRVLQAKLPQQLSKVKGHFDIAFIDPPFFQQLLLPTIERIEELELLQPNALVYIECEKQLKLVEIPQHWEMIKSNESSDCRYHLYVTRKK